MEDNRVIFDVLEAVDALGVQISIDDFGTGFSSLTHLRRLPIHEIKIDRSFIGDMLARENDRIIARSIIDLAHNLGHRVVAEGVEDAATLELLRELGCEMAQGFLFSQPGPLGQICALLDTGTAIGRMAVSAGRHRLEIE
ncbi:MAG: EAL domain-containing protein [Acidimicrobiales bacterium]|nr:EAL domain-containing protein [Acidimicrobiales bacterium]MDG1876038.1 EAL domain-containing protein [Acidimicrobiales bacterium]